MLAAALVAATLAAPGPPARLERVAAGFEQPVYVTGVPGRPRTLAVVERYGRVRLLLPGRARRPVLVDLRSRVGIDDPRETVDQRGLLSIAFAPDYARSGRLYLDYVDRDGRLRVDEWRRGTLRPLLDLGPATTQHHGGQLQFGPDGLLYVSTGMGDDPDTSQDPASPGGKILRVDPLAPRPEVVALGLRNPWRFSFHRGTLLIGDVGEHSQEEVDVLRPGAAPVNFGWPFREGRATVRAGAPAGLRGPEIAHRHARGWCSLVGGYVVRGHYVYGDVCSGRLWSAQFRAGALGRPRRLALVAPYLVSFGRDRRGRVYAVSLNGPIWRLRRTPRR